MRDLQEQFQFANLRTKPRFPPPWTVEECRDSDLDCRCAPISSHPSEQLAHRQRAERPLGVFPCRGLWHPRLPCYLLSQWIGGPTISRLYFFASARSVSASAPC